MRILYLCFDPSIDLGAETGGAVHVRAMIRAMQELGHELTVLGTCVSRAEWIESQTGARVIPCGIARLNRALGRAIRKADKVLRRRPRRFPDAVRLLHNAAFFRKAAKVARRFSPDFIYERYSLWGMAGLTLAKRCGVPLALEVNAPLVYEQQRYRQKLAWPRFAQWMERRVWRAADPVIAVSEPLHNHLEEAGVAPERIRILPNAVDADWFALDAGKIRPPQDLEKCDKFVVGFVGSFKVWHGADFLLSVFEDFHKMEPLSRLLLIGDGPLKEMLQERAYRAGLAKAVVFTGIVPHEEIRRYLAAVDVAVAPYPAVENFYYSPLKLFEYLAAGVAVVASSTGQVSQLIRHRVNGLLYQPGDREALLRCLGELRKDAPLREELGKNAKKTGAAFTWERNAARVIGWIQPRLLQGNLPVDARRSVSN
jgi:glycosyltransferase involved in cell wall biosynthesis